jgi:putative ubiquitin-RnfH superfamily antitoxin RatB of RatAB toxin-antitoxin module
MTDIIHIEVSYALPDKQVILTLDVDKQLSIEDIIKKSGILEQFPEIDLSQNKVGVFGKLKKLTNALREGDRIEIYRPLIADPKKIRKERAASGKLMKKGAR